MPLTDPLKILRYLLWLTGVFLVRFDRLFTRLMRWGGYLGLPAAMGSGIWLSLLTDDQTLISLEIIRGSHIFSGFVLCLVFIWLILRALRKMLRRSPKKSPPAYQKGTLFRFPSLHKKTVIPPVSLLHALLWLVLVLLLFTGGGIYNALYHGEPLPGSPLGHGVFALHSILPWYLYAGFVVLLLARGRTKLKEIISYLQAP